MIESYCGPSAGKSPARCYCSELVLRVVVLLFPVLLLRVTPGHSILGIRRSNCINSTGDADAVIVAVYHQL